jgi:hypothetical protein
MLAVGSPNPVSSATAAGLYRSHTPPPHAKVARKPASDSSAPQPLPPPPIPSSSAPALLLLLLPLLLLLLLPRWSRLGSGAQRPRGAGSHANAPSAPSLPPLPRSPSAEELPPLLDKLNAGL